MEAPRLDPDNLQGLFQQCRQQKTAEEQTRGLKNLGRGVGRPPE